MVRGPGERSLRAAARGGALALALLFPAVLAAGAAPPAGPAPVPGPAAGPGVRPAESRPVRPASAPAAAPAQPAAEREVCADGQDPAASLRPSAAAGDAVRRIQGRGRLVVGVDQNSYRWGYRDPASGELTGFDVDLVKAIAEDLLGPDPDVIYKTVPTDQRLAAIRSGDVDMVVRTMSITCDRIEQVAFSTAYFEAGQQVLVPRSSAIDGYNSSLAGRRVCTARGSTGQDQLRRESHGAVPVYTGNQLDCLVLLQLGRIDAVLTDNALAAGQAAQDPTVHLVGDPVTAEPYGVAMSLADEDLVRRVNKVLDDYRRGGRSSLWRTAYDTWLADVMRDPRPAPPAPAYRD